MLCKRLRRTDAVWAVTSSYSLQFWPAVWRTRCLSARIKDCFLSKRTFCATLNWSLVRVNVNFVSERIDPFKVRLTSRLWFAFFGLRWKRLYWILEKKSNQQTRHWRLICFFFCLRVQICACVQECKSWSGMVFFWRGKPTKRYRGSSDSRVMKRKCASDCEYNLCVPAFYC